MKISDITKNVFLAISVIIFGSSLLMMIMLLSAEAFEKK